MASVHYLHIFMSSLLSKTERLLVLLAFDIDIAVFSLSYKYLLCPHGFESFFLSKVEMIAQLITV